MSKRKVKNQANKRNKVAKTKTKRKNEWLYTVPIVLPVVLVGMVVESRTMRRDVAEAV